MPRNMQNAETACGGHRLIGARSQLKRFGRRRADRPAIILFPGKAGNPARTALLRMSVCVSSSPPRIIQ